MAEHSTIISAAGKEGTMAPPLSRYQQAKDSWRKQKTFRNSIRSGIYMLLGILAAGFGLRGFLMPNHFIDGGVTGISLLINAKTSFPLPVVRRRERDRDAVGAGAAGAADAVHVVFGALRQIEVDDVRDAGDVDAARGDVGRHQQAHLAAAQAGRSCGCAGPGSCRRAGPRRMALGGAGSWPAGRRRAWWR